MNSTLIDQLIDESTEVVDDFASGTTRRVFSEKTFARLIINECIKQCVSLQTTYDEFVDNVDDCALRRSYIEGSSACYAIRRKINDHFGVENARIPL